MRRGAGREIKNVLMLGSGPVVIGQAAEFDYSGTQAVRSLKQEGLRVVLLNPNPATVMTDPRLADRTYLEPLTVETATWILEREKIDGVVAGLGGQAALNLTTELEEAGVLERLGVRVLGTQVENIKDAEDRGRFARVMEKIGVPIARSKVATTVEEAFEFARRHRYPLVVRPAFTLGGEGGGMVVNDATLRAQVEEGLRASPVNQVLVEEGLFGWKELEFEVVRDGHGDSAVICGMENVDPVGVHTGDSLVVAPILTIPDPVVQDLRSASLAAAEALGIVGACNVQFALGPDNTIRVIEANPRASRSSALASKAVGYPIAQIAAKLALGRRLADLPNPATGGATACFEPAVDYVAVKMPRWPFDKLPGAPRRLGTRMRATGEVLAIDRTFPEAMAKAWAPAPGSRGPEKARDWSEETLLGRLREPCDERPLAVAEALRRGRPMSEVISATLFDPFFCQGLLDSLSVPRRRPVRYKAVDSCAGESDAQTPYFYSVADGLEDEGEAFGEAGVVVLGSGPIRIGCGLEFDYGAVMATQGLRGLGLKTILVNDNPETVSTDFDAADRLYFEPVSEPYVLAMLRKERPRGVLVQFGGQTALDLAARIEEEGFRVLGTTPDAIDRAEDRGRFLELLEELAIPFPKGEAADSLEAAQEAAKRLGLPLMVRPSRVLGGRAMQVVERIQELEPACQAALDASGGAGILLDRFLTGLELEADVVTDGREHLVGLMEHLEAAGVHSGDSTARFPTRRAPPEACAMARDQAVRIAEALGAVGMLNFQFVWDGTTLFCLEANPRASRTVPFLAKATGLDLPGIAARASMGVSLREQGIRPGDMLPLMGTVSFKVPAFSFGPMTGVDPVVGPEMLATGESMGISDDGAAAFAKAMRGARSAPKSDVVYAAVPAGAMAEAIPVLERYLQDGFEVHASPGTADALRSRGHDVKYRSLRRAIEDIRKGAYGAVINLRGGRPGADGEEGFQLRRAAVESRTPLFTRLETARAARIARTAGVLQPVCLQDARIDPRLMLAEPVEPGTSRLQDLPLAGEDERARGLFSAGL